MAIAELAAAIKQAMLDSGANPDWALLDTYALSHATAIWNNGASGGGWVTDLDIDFSTLPAQQFLTDGTYTIAGLPWMVQGRNHASLAANGFEINGDLICRGPADAGSGGAPDTIGFTLPDAASITLLLKNACAGLRGSERLRVWCVFSRIPPQGGYSPAYSPYYCDLCVFPDYWSPHAMGTVQRRGCNGSSVPKCQMHHLSTWADRASVLMTGAENTACIDLRDGVLGSRVDFLGTNTPAPTFPWPDPANLVRDMIVNYPVRALSTRFVTYSALSLVFPMFDDSPADYVAVRRLRIDRCPETGP